MFSWQGTALAAWHWIGIHTACGREETAFYQSCVHKSAFSLAVKSQEWNNSMPQLHGAGANCLQDPMLPARKMLHPGSSGIVNDTLDVIPFNHIYHTAIHSRAMPDSVWMHLYLQNNFQEKLCFELFKSPILVTVQFRWLKLWKEIEGVYRYWEDTCLKS